MASAELLLGISNTALEMGSKHSPDFLQARQAAIDAFKRNLTPRGVIAAIGRFQGVFLRDAGTAACTAMEKEQNGASPILQEAAVRTLRTGAERQGTRYTVITREMKGAVIHESHGPDSDQNHLSSIAASKNGKWVRFVNGHYEGENYRGLDPTLWWISLYGTYVESTGDYTLMEELLPNFERAVAWLDRYGKRGVKLIKGGFERGRPPRNLGIKDSENAFIDEDGNFPDYPVAPLDVQCVACVADRKAAMVFELIGNQKRAKSLRLRAEERAELIDKSYWLEEYSVYAPAVDRNDQPVRVRTSDSAYALWAGVTNGRSSQVARSMLESDLFIPGEGLLTRSTASRQFNPEDYQNGNLWYYLAPVAAAGCEKLGLMWEAKAFDTCIPTIVKKNFPELSAVDKSLKLYPYTEIDSETGEQKEVGCTNFTMTIGATLNRLAA